MLPASDVSPAAETSMRVRKRHGTRMTIRVSMPLQGNVMSKIAFAALLAALLLCAGCSGMAGSSSSSSGGSSGITMYGTIDEGVTIRK
jgi:hypothetical protein